MRLAYFTDPHLYDRDISTRNDQSSLAALAKLRQLVSHVLSAQIPITICGGDLFADRVDSSSYMAAIVEQLRLIAPGFFTLVGNHDIVHRETENYRRRNLAVLVAAEACLILDDKLLDDLGILGLSAFNEAATIAAVVEAGKADKVRAIFSHHFINHGRDRLVLSTKDLKSTFPNLKHIFSGHDHAEYPDLTIDGIVVHRPGGALRTSTAYENVKRIPKFLDVEFDKDWNDVRCTPVPYICLQGEDVFNLDIKAMNKSSEAALEEFVNDLVPGSGEKAPVMDLETLIARMASESGDPDIVAYVQNDMHALLSS